MKYKLAYVKMDNRSGILLSTAEVTGLLKSLEQRLAAAEAKNTELEKELFVLSSDVIYCGCGHVTAGLQEKAKRIYGKLRESGGEG